MLGWSFCKVCLYSSAFRVNALVFSVVFCDSLDVFVHVFVCSFVSCEALWSTLLFLAFLY